MNKDLLAKEVIRILGVSESDKELALDLFLSKLADSLNIKETIKITDLGVFHIKDEKAGKKTILYSPQNIQSVKDSGSLYVTFDVDTGIEDIEDFDDSVFSIGIGKPMLPVNKGGEGEDDFSKSILKKSINERIGELIANAVKLDDFNLWGAELAEDEKTEPDDGSVLDEEDEIDIADTYDAVEDQEEVIETEEDNKVEDVEEKLEEEEDFEFIDEVEPAEKEKVTEEPVEEEENIFDEIENEMDNEENELSESDSELLDSLLKEQDEIDDVESDHDDKPKIEWNWGDELKEEFLSKDELDEIDVDIQNEVFEDTEVIKEEENNEPEVEIKDEDILEDEEENIEPDNEQVVEEPVAEEDNSTEPLEEEESGDPEKNDDQKEEDIEQVEQEKPKEKTKGKRILKFRDMTNKGDWKKIGFGKSFWIILSLFVIIAIIGIYIFLFDDSDSSHEIVAEDSTKVVQEKTEGVKDSAIAAFLEDDKNATVDTTNKEATDNNQHIEEESTPQLKTEQEQPDKTLDITPEIRVITNEKRINGNIYFDGNKYMLQVASFKSKSRAERHARSLRQQGHNAFIVEADLPQLGGTWYRVRIGDFNSQQAAQNYLIEHKF